jgi:hypothetical protein
MLFIMHEMLDGISLREASGSAFAMFKDATQEIIGYTHI